MILNVSKTTLLLLIQRHKGQNWSRNWLALCKIWKTNVFQDLQIPNVSSIDTAQILWCKQTWEEVLPKESLIEMKKMMKRKTSKLIILLSTSNPLFLKRKLMSSMKWLEMKLTDRRKQLEDTHLMIWTLPDSLSKLWINMITKLTTIFQLNSWLIVNLRSLLNSSRPRLLFTWLSSLFQCWLKSFSLERINSVYGTMKKTYANMHLVVQIGYFTASILALLSVSCSLVLSLYSLMKTELGIIFLILKTKLIWSHCSLSSITIPWDSTIKKTHSLQLMETWNQKIQMKWVESFGTQFFKQLLSVHPSWSWWASSKSTQTLDCLLTVLASVLKIVFHSLLSWQLGWVSSVFFIEFWEWELVKEIMVLILLWISIYLLNTQSKLTETLLVMMLLLSIHTGMPKLRLHTNQISWGSWFGLFGWQTPCF